MSAVSSLEEGQISQWLDEYRLSKIQKGAWSPEAIERALKSSSYKFLAWDHQGELASLVLFTQVEEILEIHFLATLEKFHGRGCMKSLLKHLILQFNFEYLWLEVHAKNTPAVGLYLQQGFKICGERPNYYGDGAPALILALAKNPRKINNLALI